MEKFKEEKKEFKKQRFIEPKDVDVCKSNNDCETKCCINNQCVDSNICKKIKKEEEKMKRQQKKMEKKDQEMKKRRKKEKEQMDKRIEVMKDTANRMINFSLGIGESQKNFEKRQEMLIKKGEDLLEKYKVKFYTENEKDEEKQYLNLKKSFENFKDRIESKEEEKEEETDISDVEEVLDIGEEELMEYLEETDEEKEEEPIEKKKTKKQIKLDNKFEELLNKIKMNTITDKEIDNNLKKLGIENEKEYISQVLLVRLNQML